MPRSTRGRRRARPARKQRARRAAELVASRKQIRRERAGALKAEPFVERDRRDVEVVDVERERRLRGEQLPRDRAERELRVAFAALRSEERRVGEECWRRWWAAAERDRRLSD